MRKGLGRRERECRVVTICYELSSEPIDVSDSIHYVEFVHNKRLDDRSHYAEGSTGARLNSRDVKDSYEQSARTP